MLEHKLFCLLIIGEVSVLTTLTVACITICNYFTDYSRLQSQSAALLPGYNFCNLELGSIALG